MNLSELRDKCNLYINLGHETDDVVVTLSNPNVGGRAYTSAKTIAPGDSMAPGERNLIYITPLLKVAADGSSRDDPMKAYKVHTSIRSVIKCPKCGSHLRNKDKYCAECGQAIMKGEYIDINMGGL